MTSALQPCCRWIARLRGAGHVAVRCCPGHVALFGCCDWVFWPIFRPSGDQRFYLWLGLAHCCGADQHLLGVKAGGNDVFDTVVQLVHAPGTNLVTLGIGAGSVLFHWCWRASPCPHGWCAWVPVRAWRISHPLAPMLARDGVHRLGRRHALGPDGGRQHRGHGAPKTCRSSACRRCRWRPVGSLWLPALLIRWWALWKACRWRNRWRSSVSSAFSPTGNCWAWGRPTLPARCRVVSPSGGFARSVVNFAAGANTPGGPFCRADGCGDCRVDGLFTVAHAPCWQPPSSAVVSLIDLETLREAWHYDKADAMALVATAGAWLLA